MQFMQLIVAQRKFEYKEFMAKCNLVFVRKKIYFKVDEESRW